MEPSADGVAVGDFAPSAGSLQQRDASIGALRRCTAAGFTGQVPSQDAARDRITATQNEVAELRGVLHRLVAKVDEERQARLEAHAEVMAQLAMWPARREGLLTQVLAEVRREHSAREVELRCFMEESQRFLQSADLAQETQKDIHWKLAISEVESAEDGMCSSSPHTGDECCDRSKLAGQMTQATLDMVSPSVSASTAAESLCCKESLAESVGAVPGTGFAADAPLPTGDFSLGSSSRPTALIVTCVDAHTQHTSPPAMEEHSNGDVGPVGEVSFVLAADVSCSLLSTLSPPNLHTDTPVVAEVSPLTTAVVRLLSAPALGGSEQVQPLVCGRLDPQSHMFAPPTFRSAPANAARRRPKPRGSPLPVASSGIHSLPSPGGLAGPSSAPCRGRPDQSAAFKAAMHSPFASMPCSQVSARPGAQCAATPGAQDGLTGMKSIVQTSTKQSTQSFVLTGMQTGTASPVSFGRPVMPRARSTPRLGYECAPGMVEPIRMLRLGAAADPRWRAGVAANPSHGLSQPNGQSATPGPVSATEFRPHQRPSSVPVREKRRGDLMMQEPPSL